MNILFASGLFLGLTIGAVMSHVGEAPVGVVVTGIALTIICAIFALQS